MEFSKINTCLRNVFVICSSFVFFKKEESLVFCSDIDGLLKELRIAHEPNEWRLFIDDSKLSLKVVLLNNGNELPFIPVAHAVYMKETYHNLK
ncbi:hypothetical protein AVEN_261992-1 [Araneus ventricosus]|uniref:Reverse transcriptase domain-containing protein n=1 Tax=Araneus ventricosus TaxID=182803 RepID=A0A4Y2HCB6_ARAVE|nr:hypothetical protein AVEN_261992-1 [Araneus ventricosus]